MHKTVKPTTFTLSISLVNDINVMAKELNKKKTQIVIEALEIYMDCQDLRLAKERLNDNSTRLSAEEFFKELGAWVYELEVKSSVKKDFKI